jgi:hypothetical protein
MKKINEDKFKRSDLTLQQENRMCSRIKTLTKRVKELEGYLLDAKHDLGGMK